MRNNHLLNMKFNELENASHFHHVVHYLTINRSIEEKDKLIDELLIRRCEKIRDDLIGSAYHYFDKENNAKTPT